MPDIPRAIREAAYAAFMAEQTRYSFGKTWAGSQIVPEVDAVLAAVAPLLARACADAILTHAEEHGERIKDPWARRRWRRHMGIAARVAAGAFTTETETLRQAADAINRGEFAACNPETPGEVD